ncbi:hypothetical protein TREMEDRAFT_61775 [Tremella mesenterica DSM 1558]|uniref:uncharacterized protein n=1 Tax=Tremella mesenterica (strain ATCC 24925 / CBS 8224 / DSM 1558 / NBRC 9311 / NRRL Y-6157 / RJB 2259-6 / UBC 559-6) TaxID=578456 RepID=UPI0003F48FDA|nr:uncharacterized protein TREMEDRAFT_61775 [Tremella mesenterica DSM 1558]EIW70009.1 hypothetical protein TREMEDRAFT_61775 [Tremella mesenterica DSM 1558]
MLPPSRSKTPTPVGPRDQTKSKSIFRGKFLSSAPVPPSNCAPSSNATTPMSSQANERPYHAASSNDSDRPGHLLDSLDNPFFSNRDRSSNGDSTVSFHEPVGDMKEFRTRTDESAKNLLQLADTIEKRHYTLIAQVIKPYLTDDMQELLEPFFDCYNCSNKTDFWDDAAGRKWRAISLTPAMEQTGRNALFYVNDGSEVVINGVLSKEKIQLTCTRTKELSAASSLGDRSNEQVFVVRYNGSDLQCKVKYKDNLGTSRLVSIVLRDEHGTIFPFKPSDRVDLSETLPWLPDLKCKKPACTFRTVTYESRES